MRIGILGPLELADNGRPIDVGGARLRALLTLLALDAGRLLSADRIIDDMWEDRPPAGAANALQSLVSRLRATVGRDLIESRPSGYRLAVPRHDIDAHDFEARVRRARTVPDPAARAAELRAALELWRGPALADVARLPFAEAPVARLEGLRRSALEERIEADLELGRHAELIPELQSLAAADPLREPLRGRLMRALYAEGRQAEALAVYEDTKRALAEALGVDPSPDLEGIYLSVLRQDPTLSSPSPMARSEPSTSAAPVRTMPGSIPVAVAATALSVVPEPAEADPVAVRAETPPSNLRSRLTSFIGRDEDLRRVCDLLGESRLVTLTGPGGAGKTRLSVESGERMLGRLPDGVWLVELAPVADPAEVPHAVLTALGLRETAVITARGRMAAVEATDPLDRLAAVLGGKRLLILLDNCEHVIDAAARLADKLLADCPGVRVLATSREPLGITGETLWPVEPLALPRPDATPGDAVTYPAVRLFADRASAVRPGFAVADGNVGHVLRICRALDGMPLAIELAAARLRALTAEQIAARLDDRFRLLTAGSRTALPRHQTLRAVVEWSWDLLDDAERVLWRRLAVFAGSVTVESAEAVCAGAGLAVAEVFDTLSALVDKSLVLLRGDGSGPGPWPDAVRGVPRYLMLETIRAYGLERLAEADEQDRTRRAHAEYFLRLAEAAEPNMRGGDQIYWLGRMAAEHDNVHAALRWAISAGDAATAARFCAALGWYWWLRGHWSEGNETAAEVLAMPGLPHDETTAVAATLAALSAFGGHSDVEVVKGWLRLARDICDSLGDEPLHPVLRLTAPIMDMAASWADEASLGKVEVLFEDADPWVRALGRFVHGQIALNLGKPDSVDEDFAVALEEFRSVGDRWGISFALTSQAELHGWRGEHREAVALYEESLELVAELGIAAESISHFQVRLANELSLLGELERARELLTTVLRSAERRRGTPEAMTSIQCQLGEFARRVGDHEEAAARLDRAAEMAVGQTGPPQSRAVIGTSRGLLAAAVGDLATARSRLREAFEHAVSSMDGPIMAQVLIGYSDLAEREGDLDRAAELLGQNDGVRGMRDLSMPDAIRLEDSLRTTLGEQAFTLAYERGRAKSLDDILAEFGMTKPPPPTL